LSADLQILAVFAAFKHATIVDGIELGAKAGRWHSGQPPLGYRFSDELRTLVPDPVIAPVVRPNPGLLRLARL